MNNRPHFYSKLPFPKERLNHKVGELTYQRADFLVTARGEFLVAGPNTKGLCEVMFQYVDETDSKWVRIYLGQRHIDNLVFPKKETDAITCKDILEDGLDLDKKK